MNRSLGRVLIVDDDENICELIRMYVESGGYNGRVIYAGWYGGYGQVVILDHGVVRGQPITTLYAHMSSISVHKGQTVSKGQTVGREGSTGYSTGPHCHFEVRVNGQPRNPLNYI